ncbi:SH3 domain-containing protein [Thioclava sp. FR2]|uniref:SH3 domain-containing protein n=1 Tax=Thioclava sp. FR2 TaxID=3445780 RepID=UPI003EBE464F
MPASAQTRAALPGTWEVTGLAKGAFLPLYKTPKESLNFTGAVRNGDKVLHMGCTKVASVSWCEVQKVASDKARGFMSEQFLVKSSDPPPPTGPEFLYVKGLKEGDRLNVRRDPNASSRILATLGEGEKVRNLGCEKSGAATWCRIKSTEGIDVTGWVNGKFLTETAPKPTKPPKPTDPGPGTGGTWEVTGLRGNEVLRLYQGASTSSRVLLSLINGDRVQGLGCQDIAGRAWCRVRFTDGVDVTGWADARYFRETKPAPKPPTTEPRFWVVSGLRPGDKLNVRDAPSTTSRIIANAPEGTRFANLGCQTYGNSQWCHVRTTQGLDVQGYVSARYLAPSR